MLTNKAEHSAPRGGSFECSLCPNGKVCLRWREMLLLHFGEGDLSGALQCLENILGQPSCAFSLGSETFCACRAADDHLYLVCQDRVVLRLVEEEARNLHTVLTSARAELEKSQSPPPTLTVM